MPGIFLARTHCLAARQKISWGPLRADGGTQRGGQGFSPARDVFVALGLDHHARQRLGARIAQHHAARFAQRAFRVLAARGQPPAGNPAPASSALSR